MSVIVATPWIDFSALWRILVVGLLAGAGLPAVFAIGLRALNSHTATSQAATSQAGAAPGSGISSDEQVYGGRPIGLVGAAVCFAVVLAAIGYGVYFIVHGS